MVRIEAEIPILVTSRQAGTSQPLLALASLLNGVSHHRWGFHVSCPLRRVFPAPALWTLWPHLSGANCSCGTSKRGGRWHMLGFPYMRGFGAWSTSIKIIKQPSAEQPSALLVAQSRLPFATDHLHLVSAAVRGQLAIGVCDLGHTNRDLRSHLLEKSSCSQA